MKNHNPKLKALVKEMVKEGIGDMFPGDQPTFRPNPAKIKDELQDVMLHPAKEFFRKLFRSDKGWGSEREANAVHNAYSDLEDLLVDAMMGYSVPMPREEQYGEDVHRRLQKEEGGGNYSIDDVVDKGAIIDVLAELRRKRSRMESRGIDNPVDRPGAGYSQGYYDALKHAVEKLMKVKARDSR